MAIDDGERRLCCRFADLNPDSVQRFDPSTQAWSIAENEVWSPTTKWLTEVDGVVGIPYGAIVCDQVEEPSCTWISATFTHCKQE